MKDLVILMATSDDLHWSWQTEVQINNFRKFGYSHKLQVLLYLPQDRKHIGWNPIWEKLEKRYPEVKFFRYEDLGIFNLVMSVYKSLCRPHILSQHFEKYPELKEKAIFYIDPDIIFTKYLDFTPFLEDDICYLSDTNGYVNATYFDSKFDAVKPELRDQYIQEDILGTACKMVGITREIAVKYNDHSGGAQYLFKNIDKEFWDKVFEDCVKVKLYLADSNQRYMPGETGQEREDRGIQSWCTDMFVTLWNIWHRGMETKVVPELDFAWATDHISKWDRVNIFHNAGAGPAPMRVGDVDHQLFYKGHRPYVDNLWTPFDDREDSYLSATSPDYCSYKYVEEILYTKKQIRLLTP